MNPLVIVDELRELPLGIEYELDPVTKERTGRVRCKQFAYSLRADRRAPSARGDQPFVWPRRTA